MLQSIRTRTILTYKMFTINHRAIRDRDIRAKVVNKSMKMERGHTFANES